MLLTALLSYVAGLLTALAPCVLPLLPVILGGSLTGKKQDKWRPYIIIASLVVSLILFTLLLKASTIFIGIDPKVWSIGSGILVMVLGFFMLFPDLWAQLIGKLGLEHRSQGLLGVAYDQKNSVISAILIGAALGPIFSSCSPTYAWVVATVLPSSPVLGMLYLSLYVLGIATSLLGIALLGRKLLVRIKWATDPKGWFQRGIAVLFIIVGLFVATGFDKKIQTYLVEKDFLHVKVLEEKIVPGNNSNNSTNTNVNKNSQTKFNVTPYQAPDFTGIAGWINSDPLTMSSLRGKVVLVDFWTYSCINCQRTQPYLNAWYDKYKSAGFEIIGVHAPEFAFEKVEANVQNAVTAANIKYPVALDNDFTTWRAYKNQYWPAKYLIDKDGQVRYTHFGEGKYDETEMNIQALLGTSAELTSGPGSSSSNASITPETYLGTARAAGYVGSVPLTNGENTYSAASPIKTNNWTLDGSWKVTSENITAIANSKLSYKVRAKDIYLVVASGGSEKLNISINGKPATVSGENLTDGTLQLSGARLYHVGHLDSVQEAMIDITLPAGVTINAFTFGS